MAIAPRTAAGTDASGRKLYLAVVDGRGGSVGLSVSELSDLMLTLGATDAVNLDGGGSSELATRTSRSAPVAVRNVPSDGT
ncbi:phosphodiester glycosidase family protein [Leifsonia sp. NPDC058248]|uniref:phosphodiester glycosidase family protein n=1 Tax=Leifsonia sp. NPDC058248 TaxID=3346402 RepID=UPI0036DAE808